MSVITVTEFFTQSSLIVPVFEPAIHVPPVTHLTPPGFGENYNYPQDINNQKWQLILSGQAVINLESASENDYEIVDFPSGPSAANAALTGVMCVDSYPALKYAIDSFSIPVPIAATGYGAAVPIFQVEQFTAVTAHGSNMNADGNAGFSIDGWLANPYVTVSFTAKNSPVLYFPYIFNGITLNITMLGKQEGLGRVNYQITLVGKIVFFNNQIPIIN